jgi:hypothetical protein
VEITILTGPNHKNCWTRAGHQHTVVLLDAHEREKGSRQFSLVLVPAIRFGASAAAALYNLRVQAYVAFTISTISYRDSHLLYNQRHSL